MLFASRAKSITNKPTVNEVMDEQTMLKRLQKEVDSLKKQLSSVNSNPTNPFLNAEIFLKSKRASLDNDPSLMDEEMSDSRSSLSSEIEDLKQENASLKKELKDYENTTNALNEALSVTEKEHERLFLEEQQKTIELQKKLAELESSLQTRKV